MQPLLDATRDLPNAGLIPAALLAIVGLVLWAAGRRVVKTAFATAGFVFGACAGLTLAALMGGVVPSWAAAIVLGLAFACFGAIVHRTAMALALATTLAVAAPLAVVAWVDLRGESLPVEAGPGPGEPWAEREAPVIDDDWATPVAEPEPDPYDAWLDARRDDALDAAAGDLARDSGLSDETVERLRTAGERLEAFAADCRTWWEARPPRLRPVIAGAVVAGFLCGLLLAAIGPGVATAAVTAGGGSLLWLGAARFIADRAAPSIAQELPDSPLLLLLGWLAVALVGVAVQWRFGPRKADEAG